MLNTIILFCTPLLLNSPTFPDPLHFTWHSMTYSDFLKPRLSLTVGTIMLIIFTLLLAVLFHMADLASSLSASKHEECITCNTLPRAKFHVCWGRNGGIHTKLSKFGILPTNFPLGGYSFCTIFPKFLSHRSHNMYCVLPIQFQKWNSHIVPWLCREIFPDHHKHYNNILGRFVGSASRDTSSSLPPTPPLPVHQLLFITMFIIHTLYM